MEFLEFAFFLAICFSEFSKKLDFNVEYFGEMYASAMIQVGTENLHVNIPVSVKDIEIRSRVSANSIVN